jgi:hypothetical protein
MYADRSSPAHGHELALPPTSCTGQAIRTSDIDPDYLAKVARVQDLVRAATSKLNFAANFTDTGTIRARWLVTSAEHRPDDRVRCGVVARDRVDHPCGATIGTSSPATSCARPA